MNSTFSLDHWAVSRSPMYKEYSSSLQFQNHLSEYLDVNILVTVCSMQKATESLEDSNSLYGVGRLVSSFSISNNTKNQPGKV